MAAPIASKNSQQNVFPSSKGAEVLKGIHTDIVCTLFQDKLMLVLTQYKKLGTLVLVTRDTVIDESKGEPVFTTSVLLGKDEPEYHVIARCLASKISIQKPILFALGLKDTSPQMTKELSAALEKHKCW